MNRIADRHFKGNLENWRAMEEALKAGKVRAIGVSNFLIEDVDNILNNGTITPAVNQIEVHIGHTPLALMDYCKKKGIMIEAYSPLAHGRLLTNLTIKKYADKYKVSTAQLMLRYDCQLGCVVLPKCDNVDQMRQDRQLDFEISDEDMAELKKLKL